jgi:hypothetical protein
MVEICWSNRERGIEEKELREMVEAVIEEYRPLKKILLLPPRYNKAIFFCRENNINIL